MSPYNIKLTKNEINRVLFALRGVVQSAKRMLDRDLLPDHRRDMERELADSEALIASIEHQLEVY